MRRPLILVGIFLALASDAHAAAAPAAAGTSRTALAFIAQLAGRVDVAHPNARTEKGTLGFPLQRGDKVEAAAGGSATLLFSNGNLVQLAEKTTLTIDATGPGATAGAGAAAGASPLMAGVFKSVSEGVVGGSRETGLVALAPVRGEAAKAEMILTPRQTELLVDRPQFRWRSAPGANRYVVTISGDSGELLRREIADTTLDYPADAKPLPRNADLSWKLTAANDAGTLRDEENGFRIKTTMEADTVRSHLDAIEKSAGGAAPFLAGSYLGAQGLLQDAIERMQQLGAARPHDPGPHEALGRLYRAVGLMDLAATELQTALNLSREP